MEEVWLGETAACKFMRRLKLSRAQSMGEDVAFLRSLRHEWDLVTTFHKSLGRAFDELYGKTLFDMVIESETRPLPPKGAKLGPRFLPAGHQKRST